MFPCYTCATVYNRRARFICSTTGKLCSRNWAASPPTLSHAGQKQARKMEQELRHHHQPDHSALQVVEFDETPEACYRPDYSLPQATPFDKAPEVCGHTAPEPVPLSAGPLQELEKQPSEGGEDGSLTPRVQSWWRRKRCLACITFATILGAVLGGVLGRR